LDEKNVQEQKIVSHYKILEQVRSYVWDYSVGHAIDSDEI